MTPSVSVLVPVLDEARHIEATAAAMAAQRFDGELEFLMLDGGSTDGTRRLLDEIAAADPRFRVLDNPQRTIPAALNTGLRHARGEFVVRMDAHAWYPEDYVASGVERLRRGGVDWVAGPAVPDGAGRWSQRVARALVLPLGQGGSRKWRGADAGDGGEWDLDTGVFAGVWRRSTLEDLQGWDDTFLVNEDAEMAARMLARGGRIVCLPQMAARYAPRDTLHGLFRQYWRFGYYRVRTSRRHPDALRPSHVASAGLPLIWGALAFRRLRPGAAAGCVGYAALIAISTSRGAADLPARERAGVAAALSTMHAAWSAGFLAGCVRHGLPWHALFRTVRRAVPGAAR
jgi:succinoglycan biosynthesis protein ExoA